MRESTKVWAGIFSVLFCLIVSAMYFTMLLHGHKYYLFDLTAIVAIIILAAITMIYSTWQEVPNGKPRPEDELKRGVVYYVYANFFIPAMNERLIIAGLKYDTLSNCTYWKFRGIGATNAEQLETGNRFVYLDDPKLHFRHWDDAGIIVILSAKGQKMMFDEIAEETTRRINTV